MMLAEETIPSWTSTVAVIAMLGSLLGIVFTGLGVYLMWQQTKTFREQLNVMLAQAGQPTTIAQPLAVKLVEELHEQFAGKKEFDELSKNNTERHAQIFSRIEKVEREGRDNLDRRIAEINLSRTQTMEKVSDQLQFIRESIVEVKTQLEERTK